MKFAAYVLQQYKRAVGESDVSLDGFVEFFDVVFKDNPVVSHGVSTSNLVFSLADGQQLTQQNAGDELSASNSAVVRSVFSGGAGITRGDSHKQEAVNVFSKVRKSDTDSYDSKAGETE